MWQHCLLCLGGALAWILFLCSTVDLNGTLVPLSSLLSICSCDLFRAFYVASASAALTLFWLRHSSAFCLILIAAQSTGSCVSPTGLISNTPYALQAEDREPSNRDCILCQTALNVSAIIL
ncbi:hypothetical protein HOY82DRAFT_78773 [Tuber indicum]|nr:hypothetical protein HOY82DRAFT_78773 [Tuber indicum]